MGQLQPGYRLHRLRQPSEYACFEPVNPGRRAGNRPSEQPKGVIVQYGGQKPPLKRRACVEESRGADHRHQPEALTAAEDREAFSPADGRAP